LPSVACTVPGIAIARFPGIVIDCPDPGVPRPGGHPFFLCLDWPDGPEL